MEESVYISKVNDVYIRVECDTNVAMEIRDYFTFKVPGYKFMPAYRNKVWSGDIFLYNPVSKIIYSGLLPYVIKFCQMREYAISYSDNMDGLDDIDEDKLIEFFKDLNTPFQPRSYQLSAFLHGIRNRRSLLLSPTASGKSFIIYLLTRWYSQNTLIVVPTISLVEQMRKDFISYGCDPDWIHTIMAGQDKNTDCPITITTWQSVYKLPKQWFSKYRVCIGDEAHQFKAKSLSSILEKMTVCPYRFGFTGTLDGTNTHKLVLEGLFGVVKRVTTTAKLIEDKHLADFKIKCIVLKHNEEHRKTYCKAVYHDEIDYIVRSEPRNKFISNLVLHLNGNTLILYQFVDKHGKVLYSMINDIKPNDRKLFFVSGEVGVDEREAVRSITETESNAIIVGSYGCMSTGINIRNLHNIVFASPTKSRIRSLQSIGRGLRRGSNKEQAVLYDIADDLQWKKSKNHTLNHFIERVQIYSSEQFQYKITNFQLE